MPVRNCGLAFLLALVIVPGVARAQVLEAPPRSSTEQHLTRGSDDQDRTTEELTLGASVLGGWDEHLSPPGGSRGVLVPYPSGYLGMSEADLRYQIGREARSLDVNGRGFVGAYSNVRDALYYGGDFRARARTSFWRRNELSAAQSVAYQPFWSFGAYGSLESQGEINRYDSNPSNRLSNRASVGSATSVAFGRNWTPRTTTNVEYSFGHRTYLDGGGFDGRTHTGRFWIDRSFSRASTIRARYVESHTDATERDGFVRPTIRRNADLGFRMRHGVSPTRALSLAASAGAVYVDTVQRTTRQPVDFLAPSGSGSIRMDVGRSWTVGADYQANVSMLHGYSAEPFLTHTAIASTGGQLKRHIGGVFSVAYSNGRSSGEVAFTREDYRVLSAGAQVQFALTQEWSAVVNLNHFWYEVNDTVGTALGVLPDVHRNTVHVGFTWSTPLLNTARQGRSARTARD